MSDDSQSLRFEDDEAKELAENPQGADKRAPDNQQGESVNADTAGPEGPGPTTGPDVGGGGVSSTGGSTGDGGGASQGGGTGNP